MYAAVMAGVGDALMLAASALLAPGRAAELDYEGADEEFGLALAEAMAEFGAAHLQSVLSPDSKILFLQQARALLHACMHAPRACMRRRQITPGSGSRRAVQATLLQS